VFSDDARAVVSEPLGSIEHIHRIWTEIPASSAVLVEGGKVKVAPLRPRVPG
jgi:hypothetical protein